METPTAVLMVELVMSVDRVIHAARSCETPKDNWPAQVVVGHLAMNDRLNWMPRVSQMVTAHRAGSPPVHFEWYEPPASEFESAYADVDLDQASADLLASRTALVTQLRELSASDWLARAQHDVFGAMDVRGLLIQVLAHDEHHRADLLGVNLEGNLEA